MADLSKQVKLELFIMYFSIKGNKDIIAQSVYIVGGLGIYLIRTRVDYVECVEVLPGLQRITLT